MSERGHDAQRRGAHRVASSIDRRLSWASLAAGLFGDEAAPVPVGPYLLCRELGRGSSGTVYLARDPVLQRDVALKLLHPGHGSPAAMLQEARALARLSAPNIVSVYGVGEHEGLVYIAMALAPGPTLRQWQAQTHRTPDDVLAAYRQAGLGLQAAHEQGVYHRDFKPDNVRVGDDGRALVLDFGFAGAVEGSTSGTPAYMAPEQMLAHAGDARADQFSFCVALYEGLFGQRPFEAEAGPARLDEIRAGRVRRPPADSSLPREIVEVLRQGLAYDPQSRHASMRELLDALLVAAASSPQQRARRILLTRVEAFWIDGVLRAALGGEPPLPLELSTQPAPSHDPWRERPPQDRAAAPAGEPTSVARALERAPECLVLLGAAGAGKTTLLLQHAASLVRHAREREDAPLPIVLSLSSWDEHTAIEDWLGAELQARYGIPPGFSRAWIDEDRMTLLLDGLDVLAQSRRAACIAALERWCARSLHAAVITSRPPSEATAAWPTGAAVVAIQPLSLHALERALASEPSLQALRAAIDGDPALTDLARNPLALSLLRAIHRETQASGAAPRARAQLWQAYVQRMLDRGGARTGASAKTTRRTLGFVARRHVPRATRRAVDRGAAAQLARTPVAPRTARDIEPAVRRAGQRAADRLLHERHRRDRRRPVVGRADRLRCCRVRGDRRRRLADRAGLPPGVVVAALASRTAARDRARRRRCRRRGRGRSGGVGRGGGARVRARGLRRAAGAVVHAAVPGVRDARGFARG
ncbi:MAG: protein kinase [Nannocystaceae bacterium]